MKPYALFFLVCAAAVLADNRAGLRPRASADEYPAAREVKGAKIAAHVLPTDEVRSAFATDLARRYAVVEIAVYPAAGQIFDVSDLDFALKYEGRPTSTRAASARTIAAALSRRPAQGKDDVTLYPTVGIGHSSGPDWTDASGRTRSAGGTNVGVGVGVGVGGNRDPAPSPSTVEADRRTMEQELSDKALPVGPVTKPVAGYLYFPLPQKKTVIVQELEYQGESGPVRIPFSKP